MTQTLEIVSDHSGHCLTLDAYGRTEDKLYKDSETYPVSEHYRHYREYSMLRFAWMSSQLKRKYFAL